MNRAANGAGRLGPTLIEDAYPVERFAFELLAPWRFGRNHDGGNTHAFIPEIAYGILPNGQLGLKVRVAAYTFGPEGRPRRGRGGQQVVVRAAIDRTLYRQSLLLIGEVYARRPTSSEPTQVNTFDRHSVPVDAVPASGT